MSDTDLAVQLTRIEAKIRDAVHAHGDIGWSWAGFFSNPNVAPIAWNDIRVRRADQRSYLIPAIDYIGYVTVTT